MKNMLRIAALLLAFAVVFSLTACLGTSQNNEEPPIDGPNSYIDEPTDLDDPQQYIEVSREGTVEKIPVEMVKGIAADYTIAMDPEYFTFSSDGEYDTFTYENWGGSTNVYYCIYPCTDMTAQQFADGIVHMYGDNYADCFTERAAVGMYDAAAVYLYDSLYDEDAQMRFYAIETDYGCLVIEAQFVTEMYEGLYAIMRACFDTITLTEANAGQQTQSQPTPAQLSLMKLQKQIADEAYLFGTAYLGYYDVGASEAIGEFSQQPYWENFQFLDGLEADRCVLADGAEWYVIIPASAEVKLTIYEYYFDFEKDYIEGVNPGAGREYISVSDGNPVLVRGNISDILPNLLVKAEGKDGSVVEYNPCLSLENGRLSTYSGGVCDLTPYELMPQFIAEPVFE